MTKRTLTLFFPFPLSSLLRAVFSSSSFLFLFFPANGFERRIMLSSYVVARVGTSLPFVRLCLIGKLLFYYMAADFLRLAVCIVAFSSFNAFRDA